MGYIAPYLLTGVTPPDNLGDIQEGGVGVEFKPPFIAAPKCAKVEVKFTCDGMPAENVFYFAKASGNFALADCVALSNTVATQWENFIVPIWGVNTALYMVRVSDMSAQFGPVYEHAIEPAIVGLRSATAPASVDNCVGVAFHTGFKGRSANGRIFVSGTCLGDFADSIPTDAARLLYLTAVGDFMVAVALDGYVFVLVSFMTKKQWRAAAQVTTVVAFTVGQYIYTMRRRLPGHNRHR